MYQSFQSCTEKIINMIIIYYNYNEYKAKERLVPKLKILLNHSIVHDIYICTFLWFSGLRIKFTGFGKKVTLVM